MIYIYPYNLFSKSARALRKGLSSLLKYRVKLVRPHGRFNPRRRDRVINWGSYQPPSWEFNHRDNNDYAAISVAANKLHTFQVLKLYNVPTPEWTTDINEAKAWLTKANTTVFLS